MQLIQHFKELTVRPKNAKELKGLILQLAIQGKLTVNWREENPDVEPASELLKRIQTEKESLVQEKIIRKEKPLPEVSKDEIPYILPKDWVWNHLGNICIKIVDGSHNPPPKHPNGIPMLSAQNVRNGVLTWNTNRYISEDDFEKEKKRNDIKKNDVFLTIVGTIGRTYVVNGEESNFAIQRSVAQIRTFIDSTYLAFMFRSKTMFDFYKKNAKGTAQKGVYLNKLKLALIPIPPLEEQKEIVKLVETLFKEVEQLEQLTVERIGLKEDFVTSALNQLTINNANQEWTFLQEHFKSFFNQTTNIKKLRETVLQLAVQGKLTSEWRANNRDTEDASILLKRIQIEKAQLIKDKKIKKEKALPKITKDEIPYDLPEGWVWVNFGDLATFINGDRGKNYPNKSEYVDEGVAWINTGHINPDGTLSESKMNYITEDKYDILRGGKIQDGDLVYCLRGATFGKTAYVTPFKKGAIASSLMIIRAHIQDSSGFIYRFLISPEGKRQLLRFDNGSAQPNLSANKVKLYTFPLPPLEEQKAIVEKVNALMGLCNRLEQEVQQSQEHSEMLMQSVLREVFEGELS